MKESHKPRKSRAVVAHGHILLITGQRSYTYHKMHTLIGKLALEGPLKLLIGGNRYNHYGINYALAAATCHYEQILEENIQLSRAETCYQMVELLLQTQADQTPSLILDLLTPFYDKGIPEREINQLLFETIFELRRLSQRAVVVVSAHPRQGQPQFLKALENVVDRVEYPEIQQSQPTRQYSLIG